MQFPGDLPSLYDMLRDAATERDASIARVLKKAENGSGLELEEAALLLAAGESWSDRIFEEASTLNLNTKGKQITFYGVVYIHDHCMNLCTYCGDSKHARFASRKLLSLDEFCADVKALIARHPLKQICFLTGEDPALFSFEDLVRYLLRVVEFYHEEIILNIPPLSVRRFRELRAALPSKTRLQFRVFQETYDRGVYAREHREGPKKDFDWRVASQARALEAGIDEVGHGVLYGLNDRPNGAEFDTLAMIAHAKALYAEFGRWPKSMSFPCVQPAPDINYAPSAPISEARLTRFLSIVKLALPAVETILTCREPAEIRRRLRPVVNVEDFAARPGPGGNSLPEARQQMFLPDMRSGEAVLKEMREDGYAVQ